MAMFFDNMHNNFPNLSIPALVVLLNSKFNVPMINVVKKIDRGELTTDILGQFESLS